MSLFHGTSSACVAVLLLATTNALAAGFTLNEHSAAELGLSYAGAAAAAEDASTIADNPAGLARLDRPQFAISGTLAFPALPFANMSSRLATGTPTPGLNADGGSVVVFPNLFASTPLTETVAIGLGIFPSFGLATDYPAGWVGRYHARSTNLTSFDFAPTVAYRIAPILSIGFTPVARYTKVDLSDAIDFGTIGAGHEIPGAVPGESDGSSRIKADNWSFGFNGGVLVEPTQTTRLGIAYYYNKAANLTGSAQFTRLTVGNTISSISGTFTDTNASGSVNYPDHLNMGLVQQLSPNIDLRAGLTWTQWSSFKELRILLANPNQPSIVTAENWRDTYNVAVGMTYKATPKLLLRMGISYDQTPVRGASFRTPRIPDADRITPGIGAGYELTPATRIDVAYQHIFGGPVGLNVVSATGDTLIGKTRLSADILALQLTMKY